MTGVLLALAREPVAWNLLAIFALAPLLWAMRGCSARRAALLAGTAGVVYYTLLLWWSWYFGAIAIVPFVGALAAYWAAAGAGIAWFRRRGVANPLLTAAIWVAAEALVSRFPWGGFSWGEVGYALSGVTVARSLASWGGVLLVSFLVVAFADFLVDAALALHAGRYRPTAHAAAGLVGILVFSLLAHGFRVETTPTRPLRFALIQGNHLNRDLTQSEIDARYLPRQHFALASRLRGNYDLIVFPESSMDADPRTDPWLARQLAQVARRHHATVLANAVTDAPDGRAVNLDLVYGPDGRLRGTYAKQHLVPFGEFVPFRRWLEPRIHALRQIPRDFAPGHRVGVFGLPAGRSAPTHRIGTVICFETAFGPLVRDTVRHGADVIVVSTNNRSYRRSAQAAQHLAISQMRAAETGRPVLHASINGITGVIDASGRILQRTRLFENSVTTGEVVGTTGETPYVRLGEWVLWISLLGIGTALWVALASAARQRRSVNSGVAADGSMSEPAIEE